MNQNSENAISDTRAMQLLRSRNDESRYSLFGDIEIPEEGLTALLTRLSEQARLLGLPGLDVHDKKSFASRALRGLQANDRASRSTAALTLLAEIEIRRAFLDELERAATKRLVARPDRHLNQADVTRVLGKTQHWMSLVTSKPTRLPTSDAIARVVTPR